MPRKTVDVVDILCRVNNLLTNHKGDPAFRLGAASVLENILHEAGVYAGYGYPGSAGKFGEPGFDESRRYYYVHKALGQIRLIRCDSCGNLTRSDKTMLNSGTQSNGQEFDALVCEACVAWPKK